jgi:cellulose synthase operon protein C
MTKKFGPEIRTKAIRMENCRGRCMPRQPRGFHDSPTYSIMGPAPTHRPWPALPGEPVMTRSVALPLLLVCVLAALSTGCSRDPNLRKQKYFESGGRYFAEGKYREAAIQYANAIQIDSRFADAHYQLSQAYVKLGDQNRAYPELVRTVELAPDNYEARVDLANLLISVRNPDGSPHQESLRQAKTHLDFLRLKAPNTAETHEAWANYDAALNMVDAAMQEMQQAVALDPNRSESYVLLGLLHLRINQTDQAEASFKKAIAVDPKSLNAQMALAGFYQSRGRYPEAEQQFASAIAVDPKNPGPRAALVRLLMQEGKRTEVESFLQQTKKDLPDNSEGYRMLGDFYYATGDLDRATAEYESLYKDHPKDPQVKKNYIQLLILKNRIDEATRLDDEYLKVAPHDSDALIYKAQIYLHQNKGYAAADTLQNALRNDPDNAIAHYQLGLAFDQLHNDARAEQEWREAVRLRSDLAEAHRALAALELRRADLDGLLASAQQIIALQPNLPDGYLLKGVAEIARQDYRDAEQDAEQAMKLAPQSAAPYVQIGNVHLAQKHYAEAIDSYQQALQNDPSSADALSGVMNTYFAEKKFDLAVAAANSQIAKSPNNSNFYDLLGTALFNGKKDLPGAETALRKAVDLDKTNTDAIEKLGKVELQQNQPDQALALFQQAIKDNPRDVLFYTLVGEIYASKQNWDQAKAMYQQALGIQPDEPRASNNLAYVILEQGGNVDVALAMAQTARRGLPDSPNAADTLGWAYYRKGVYQSAISQFQEALRLGERGGAPDDATIHYHLGLAYQKANQNSLARQQLERALKLSPNNADARKALSELRS